MTKPSAEHPAGGIGINVSAWSIRNPIPSLLLFMLLTLAGLLGFKAMKIQNFPDIDLPMVVTPLALPDGRWDKMMYGIRDCEEFLRAVC